VADKVVVLDSHAFNDNRISKHIARVGVDYPVFRVNVNFYNDQDPRSPDETKAVIYFKNGHKNSFLNGMLFTLSNMFGTFPEQVAQQLEKRFRVSEDQIVFHVHDPYVLSLAKKLHRRFPESRMVYDRHEYYDAWKNRLGFSVPGIMEKMYGKFASEYVVVSRYLRKYPKFMGNKKVTVVPNYPIVDKFPEAVVREKISGYDGKSVEIVYFGALNLNFDRDIKLMLQLSERLMAADDRINIIVAGRIYHPDIGPMLSELEKMFPNRMRYLGEVPYAQVVDLMQKAHLGFFLLDPNHPMFSEDMPNSSNKIYEYLLSGIVPIVRGIVDDSEAVSECSLVFGRNATEEDMLKAILELVKDSERLRAAMQASYNTGRRFSWEDVSGRYFEIYERLFSSLNARH